MNRFTSGRWREPFLPGMKPADFESCDWRYDRGRGRQPEFWDYVKHAGCHWLANFNRKIAEPAEPKRKWRIFSSQEHSTVWDGAETLFDMNFLALGVDPDEAWRPGMWSCTAMHNGQVVQVTGPPVQRSSTGPATEMVAVDIKVGDYPVEAMVDTGCAWPMAVPKVYADALVRAGLAIRAGASSTTFADGSTHDVGIIMIGSINVDGRVLHDVEASVSPSDAAPILLGLPALNRLGSYTITDGKLVLTGEGPA